MCFVNVPSPPKSTQQTMHLQLAKQKMKHVIRLSNLQWAKGSKRQYSCNFGFKRFMRYGPPLTNCNKKSLKTRLMTHHSRMNKREHKYHIMNSTQRWQKNNNKIKQVMLIMIQFYIGVSTQMLQGYFQLKISHSYK